MWSDQWAWVMFALRLLAIALLIIAGGVLSRWFALSSHGGPVEAGMPAARRGDPRRHRKRSGH